jgi:pimeloyl-ACP methyl ester carboxylesterase
MADVPVVMVHGWGGSYALTWQPLWEPLFQDAGRTVLGVDLLGHGTAPKPHEPEAYQDLTGRILDVMPAEGQVDAIGFSLGAMTLLRLASAQPQRFRRLVVAGVGENLFREERDDRVARAVEGTGDPADVGSQIFAQYAAQPHNDRVALAAIMRRPRQPYTAEQFAAITCPVLVVIGEKDFAGPGDPLVAALPDARLVVLPRTDHFATTEHFGFVDAAIEFLAAG